MDLKFPLLEYEQYALRKRFITTLASAFSATSLSIPLLSLAHQKYQRDDFFWTHREVRELEQQRASLEQRLFFQPFIEYSRSAQPGLASTRDALLDIYQNPHFQTYQQLNHYNLTPLWMGLGLSLTSLLICFGAHGFNTRDYQKRKWAD